MHTPSGPPGVCGIPCILLAVSFPCLFVKHLAGLLFCLFPLVACPKCVCLWRTHKPSQQPDTVPFDCEDIGQRMKKPFSGAWAVLFIKVNVDSYGLCYARNNRLGPRGIGTQWSSISSWVCVCDTGPSKVQGPRKGLFLGQKMMLFYTPLWPNFSFSS